MLLHNTQRPQVIYIAGIKQLDMETCLSVSHKFAPIGICSLVPQNNDEIFVYADTESYLFVCHDYCWYHVDLTDVTIFNHS